MFSWVVRSFSDFEANLISIERIKEYCELPQEAQWEIKETKPDISWPSNGDIKFENYSLRYRSELENVLKDLNLDIKGGEKIGIVGRTGAGKKQSNIGFIQNFRLKYWLYLHR